MINRIIQLIYFLLGYGEYPAIDMGGVLALDLIFVVIPVIILLLRRKKK